jgi:ATP/ADP translocase
MSPFASGFFDVRRGEGSLVYGSTTTLFGLIAAHTMLETARDAMFLTRLSAARLPFVYVLLAGLSLIAAGSNTRFVRAFGRRNALVVTILIAAYGSAALFLMPKTPASIFGLYVWSALLGTVMVVQFWMYAGNLFTVAQGARLFGLLAAGGVLGAVAGGFTSLALLTWLSVESLLLAAAGVFLGTGLLVTMLPVDTPNLEVPRTSARSGLGLIARHPYLKRIGLLIAISTATVLTTDYLFKSAAGAAFPREELGPFFARYYTVLNAVALTVQVFVASRLVDRAGVIAAFLVLPVLLALGGAGAVVFGGAFVAVLLMKGADGSLRHSLHRISSELLWLPLPDDVRGESKAFIDTVLGRSVQAIVAACLLGLSMLNLATLPVLSGIVAVLAAIWIAGAISLRGPYLDLFRKALTRTAPDARRSLQLDLNSIEVVVEALSSRDPSQAVAAIDLLEASQRSRLIPALILYHDQEEVLIRGLEVIAKPDRKDWPDLARRLLEHASPHVRVAALRALARAGDLASVEGRMLDLDPFVRGQAAFWLAQATDAPRAAPAIVEILAMDGAAGSNARTGLLEAIRDGASGTGDWIDVIADLAISPDPKVAEVAIRAMGTVRNRRFLPILIDRLAFRANRDTVREAIVSLGDEALDALGAALESTDTPEEVRRHIPRTISKFTNQRAADILTKRLEAEPSGGVRFKILRGLGRLVASVPEVRIDRAAIERRLAVDLREYVRLMSLRHPIEVGLAAAPEADKSGALLLGLLSDKMQQALERAFRLLQIAHRSEDLRSVSFAIRATDPKLRAKALEFLSTLTLASAVPENREILKIIVDDLSTAERLDRAKAFVPIQSLNHRTAVLRLLEDEDEALAGIATYHGLEIGGLKQEVIDASKESPLRRQVKAMLEGISGLREAPSVA